MYKKNKIIMLLVLTLSLSFTGCGNSSKNENVNAGMEAVEALSYEDAIACFEQALLNGEDKELTYRGEALAYMGMTMYEEAVQSFLKAFSYSDGNISDLEYDMNYYLATAYVKLEQYTEAEAVYSSILEMRPKEEDALYLRGIVRLQQNNKDAALQDFEKVLKLDADNIDLRIDVFQALSDAGFEEEGKVYLQNMIDEKGDAISDYDLGVLSFYLGDYETARIHLDSALKENNVKATLILGQTYEALGDLNYAVVVYNTFLENNDADAEVLNRLGICKMKLQNYQDALDAFEQGIEIEQNSLMQTLKFNQIVANEYLGEFDTAKSLMEAYLEIYQADEAALREEDFLKTR